VLPDGSGVLFTIGDVGDTYWTVLLRLEDGERTVLSEEAKGLGPRYLSAAAGEYLLVKEYGADELYAVPFDLARGQVRGDRFRILEGLHKGLFDGGNLGVSSDGTLAYLSGTADLRFVWVDREGRISPVPITPRPFRRPRLSPDGTGIAVERPVRQRDGVQSQVFIYNLQGRETKLTEEGSNTNPVWAPDGEVVAFCSDRSEPGELFGKRADRTGDPWRIAATQGAPACPLSWSTTGRISTGGGWDIRLLDLEGDSILQRHDSLPSKEVAGTLSPDGRWLAYGSNRTGQYEIYVAAIPGPSLEEQVTVDGGRGPVWSKDSSELFFRNDQGLWSVRVPSTHSHSFGDPDFLFGGDFVRNPGNLANYDVAPDGRFLMMLPDSVPNDFRIIRGWDAELAQIAGGGR